MGSYLDRCITHPAAHGRGLQEKVDVDFLVGKADIAVVGSQTIREVEQKG